MWRVRLLLLRGMLLTVFLVPAVNADEADELIKKGEELYQTRHLAEGRYDQAVEAYERALALRPNDYRILWKLSQILHHYGLVLDDKAKDRKIALWEKGVRYGKRAAEVNPNGKEGHFYYMANTGALAQIKGTLTSLWHYRTIKKEMDRTLELDPRFAPALVARAQYLTELPGIFGGNNEKEAMRLYERALESDPDYLLVYYYMAQIDARQRRYDEAIARLKKIIECAEPANYANWATQERPWAEKLLKEVLKEKEKAQ